MSDLLEAMERARDAIHANCKADNPQCACACGCDEQIGCTCFTPLCLRCHMNWLRGRDPEPYSDVPCDIPELESTPSDSK